MLKYLEDSDELKVSLCEMKGQLETPEEACFSFMQIVRKHRQLGEV